MSKHRGHGRFLHGHQSNVPHFVWLAIGFGAGVVSYLVYLRLLGG